MSISAIILTKNEEKNIVDCLESLSFCNEKLVIDDNSEDNTVDLAKKNGAAVYARFLNNDFSEQRNFGLFKAKSEWALFIDADERVSENLKKEIEYLTSAVDLPKQLNGYFIKRQDFMWGKELRHGETGNIKLLRLARREAGKWNGRVHEEWIVKGKIGMLKNPILHYPHQSIKEFLSEINYYTDIRADELYNRGIKSSWFSVIFYPKIKFIQNYFIRLGILDGTGGFVFAILMSFHSFLVRGKLWLLWQKK
ncbi:MAG: glycosyltransferase family 2 protein [Cyanobacteria bacterium]|nr:glycosyltransferase family 2 protein [Cyanobacteriota bacterium]